MSYGRPDVEIFWPFAIDLREDAPDSLPSVPLDEIPGHEPPKKKYKYCAADDQPSIAKRPAASAATIMKRPAARPSRSSSSTGRKASDKSAVLDPKTMTCVKMKYTKTGAVAIRERGGRQLMQILPVKELADSAEHLTTIDNWADTCITKLENGESIDDVKNWVVEQKNPLLDALARARSDLGNTLASGMAEVGANGDAD